MTYVYNCDGYCGDDEQRHDERPALTAEFNEEWFRTTLDGGHVANEYDEGDLITLCGPCTRRLLLDEPEHR